MFLLESAHLNKVPVSLNLFLTRGDNRVQVGRRVLEFGSGGSMLATRWFSFPASILTRGNALFLRKLAAEKEQIPVAQSVRYFADVQVGFTQKIPCMGKTNFQ